MISTVAADRAKAKLVAKIQKATFPSVSITFMVCGFAFSILMIPDLFLIDN
jgi:hypothetical protein